MMLLAIDVVLMETLYLSSLAIDRLLDYDCHHSMIHLSLWQNLVEDDAIVGNVKVLDWASQVLEKVVLRMNWVCMVPYWV